METTKLVQEFGVKPLSDELIERIERVTKKPAHHFLKRGIFCGHRELERLLDHYEQGKPFFLYTGRGPSSASLHLGHLLPMIFTKYLQDVFDVPLVIQMTDDEKFLRNSDKKMEEITKYCDENLKDLIALDFNPRKTFIFRDTEQVAQMFPNILRMQRYVNINQIRATFGLSDSDNVGLFAFPIFQAVPALSSTFPQLFNNQKLKCLIPCALDQDVYFRITRDICQKIKEPKPSLIFSTFLPDLRGPKMEEMAKAESTDPAAQSKSLAELSKMSSTSKGENPAVIFLNYTPKKVAKIIKTHAFSGGAETLEEHRRIGGRPDDDLSYQYLRFFLDDDDELFRIRDEYERGIMTTGELKQILIDVLSEFLTRFQKRRSEITEDEIKNITSMRSLI